VKGGAPISNGGPGTTAPPTGDGPGTISSKFLAFLVINALRGGVENKILLLA